MGRTLVDFFKGLPYPIVLGWLLLSSVFINGYSVRSEFPDEVLFVALSGSGSSKLSVCMAFSLSLEVTVLAALKQCKRGHLYVRYNFGKSTSTDAGETLIQKAGLEWAEIVDRKSLPRVLMSFLLL